MTHAFDLNQIKERGFKYGYADDLWGIFRSYNLSVTTENQFVDNETKKFMHHNHVKCMIRRDYLNSFPEGLTSGTKHSRKRDRRSWRRSLQGWP